MEIAITAVCVAERALCMREAYGFLCSFAGRGKLNAGLEVKKISAHIDLLPTLAELCDIDLPNELKLDGKSLVPLLQDDTDDWPTRHLYTIHTEGEMRMRPGALRTDRYRMTIDRQEKVELFDMENDPGQTTDLAGDMPELKDSLLSDFTNWFQDVTSQGISVPPIPVGHPEASHTFLPAPEAKLSGGLQFMGGRGWANDYIINWQSPEDFASWDIDVNTAGNYQVEILYNGPEETVGARLQLKTTGQTSDLSIQEAFNPDPVFSPDRVERGEVYEKEWKALGAVPIKLEKGRQQISVGLLESKRNWTGVKRRSLDQSI